MRHLWTLLIEWIYVIFWKFGIKKKNVPCHWLEEQTNNQQQIHQTPKNKENLQNTMEVNLTFPPSNNMTLKEKSEFIMSNQV